VETWHSYYTKWGCRAGVGIRNGVVTSANHGFVKIPLENVNNLSLYHPYIEGYSVLPKLNKFSDEKVFCIDEHFDHYIEEKKKAINLQACVLEHDISDEVYEVVCTFIVEKMEKEFPGRLQGPTSFALLAMQLQEDLAIHRLEPDRDWLAACHVCFPSGWKPDDHIGRPLREIHAGIPGMNLEGSRKIVETMVNHGPFFRFVWTPVFEDRINCHPRKPRKQYVAGDPVFVKVERQVTIPLPEINAGLFILRQYIVKDVQTEYLAKACMEMNSDERKFKGINDEFLGWCDEKTT
jgi:hypothetical protein